MINALKNGTSILITLLSSAFKAIYIGLGVLVKTIFECLVNVIDYVVDSIVSIITWVVGVIVRVARYLFKIYLKIESGVAILLLSIAALVFELKAGIPIVAVLYAIYHLKGMIWLTVSFLILIGLIVLGDSNGKKEEGNWDKLIVKAKDLFLTPLVYTIRTGLALLPWLLVNEFNLDVKNIFYQASDKIFSSNESNLDKTLEPFISFPIFLIFIVLIFSLWYLLSSKIFQRNFDLKYAVVRREKVLMEYDRTLKKLQQRYTNKNCPFCDKPSHEKWLNCLPRDVVENYSTPHIKKVYACFQSNLSLSQALIKIIPIGRDGFKCFSAILRYFHFTKIS